MSDVDFESSSFYDKLCDQVQAELDRLAGDKRTGRPNLERELERVQNSIKGLGESLANPALKDNVRSALEAQLGERLDDESNLLEQLRSEELMQRSARQVVDRAEVLERLKRLHDVLHSGNPSEVNVELSHFVDRIEVLPEKGVNLRICPLGVSATGISHLTERQAVVAASTPTVLTEPASSRGTPRRRSIRNVENRDEAHFVADPNRFREVPESMFVTKRLEEPVRQPWPEANAEAVYALRYDASGQIKKTVRELEEHFGKSKPTIYAALRIASSRRVATPAGDVA